MLRVWSRLERTASRFLQEHSLAISMGGRLYLSYLLRKAASNIAAEGRADEDEVIVAAESQVEVLLATAGGLAAAGGVSPPLNLHAGPAAGTAGGRITAGDLRDALRQLGPIWPFAKRGS